MIETHALQFAHPGHPALSFPDVQVPQGGLLVLRGPSGSGKSTWLAMAAGLRRPTGGDMVVAGLSVGGAAPRALDAWRATHIGFLPQRLHLSEALTVQGNLQLAFFAAGTVCDDAAVARVLADLDLTALAGRRPSQLSGGQAQRVALARAVLRQPRVLLADEPTASLDDAAACAALSLLQDRASAGGATLVIATHDRRVLDALPDAAQLLLPARSGSCDETGLERPMDGRSQL